jgi:hypothetical protein
MSRVKDLEDYLAIHGYVLLLQPVDELMVQ